MAKKKITEFKVPKEVKNTIEELSEQLLKTCREYQVPMFLCIAEENNQEETVYSNAIYNPQSHGLVLKDDIIRKCMLLAHGFNAVPERSVVNLTMKDILPDENEED